MGTWQNLIRDGYRDVALLQERLQIPPERVEDLCKVQEKFPMLVNSYYLSLIDPADPDDPIRKLSIPSEEELDLSGMEDTSGEHSNTVIPGVQHKYRQTALVLSTSACALFCRHCFRRRFVGVSEEETAQSPADVAAYVAAHPEITNVLVSGGDAFMNSNEVIREYLEELCAIEHLRIIRFGTRTPVVLPQRITQDEELTDMLAEFSRRKQLYIVTHFDHPNEITDESRAAVRKLLECGVPVRNQTVLLRGINDSADVLAELLEGVSSIGVVPYYVFQCRPVTGVKSRFQVPLAESAAIVDKARRALDGPAKSFRFAMSHETGKIEILGKADNGELLFKYHQAKDRSRLGKIFSIALEDGACWLEKQDLERAGF